MASQDVQNLLKIKNLQEKTNKTDGSIVLARSTEEVQGVFRKADQEGTAIYVYREAKPQGVRLDLSLMNHIIELDCDNLVAVVEPGVMLADLADVLSQKGLRFIPADTGHYHHQTVGEWAYSGCPNVLSSKYGAGKFFVMGADFVLPTGELLKTGGKTVKNVTGYDLTRFLLGAYADMGVGVKFLLKLLPLPKKRVRFKAEFVLVSEMLSFIEKLRKLPGGPAYVLWADGVACDLELNKSSMSRHQLVCEFDGVEEEVVGITRILQTYFRQCGARAVVELEEEQEAFKGLFQGKQGFTLTDEYKIPYNRQAEFIDKAYELFYKGKIIAGLFGQLREGKVHIHFPKFSPQEEAVIGELIRLAEQVGGVSSGKYQRLYTDRKLGWLEQNVKDGFDPKHLLNR